MPKTLLKAMMGGTVLVLVWAGYLHAASLERARAQAPSATVAQPRGSAYRAVLDRYCVTCHSERIVRGEGAPPSLLVSQLRTAGLTLDTLDLANVGKDAEMWEKVVQKLRARVMPPTGRLRPDEATYDTFASWLEAELDLGAATRPKTGRAAIHRLNRAEYANAIRDLLALEIDGRSMLPADNMSYGFDNNADALSVSPALLERYMSAARKVSRLAIGDPTIRPVVETYPVSSLLVQDDRMSEDLPFGSRGGIAFRHYFPLDGEYVLSIQLQRGRGGSDTIRGLSEPEEVDVRLDGERITLFRVGGQSEEESPYSRGDRPPADAGLRVRFPAKAGMRLVGVTLLDRTLLPEGVTPKRLPVWRFGDTRTDRMGVDSVRIEGPFDALRAAETPSRRRIFVCRPAGRSDGEPCARQILGALARRAYRRPVIDEDLQVLLSFYRAGRVESGFDTGIRRALENILVDPEFLFRIERDPVDVAPSTAYRLSDLELASRLSFFLWSSIPDDQLVDLATREQLSEPAVLEQQVRRMLADPRSTALMTNFATQWLHVRNMRVVSPDVNQFPEFDDNLREAFQRETELFLESQLREDRSVVELLTANHTFVNERLARHYGIPDVYGSHFRRVTFTDERRAGLLGQASILTVTSHANRTSPVVRGKWLLDNILGAPPPPPPPDVPALQENDEGDQPRSVRERMEQHRTNPVCASCHAQMDPLGFALENFDAIGKWRDTDETHTPIDASGTLPDGTMFEGPAELRNLLRSRRDEYVMTVTSKLLTYAVGRGLEYYDSPAIRKIMREAASSDYRWSSIILGIANSTPFQMRRSEP